MLTTPALYIITIQKEMHHPTKNAEPSLCVSAYISVPSSFVF